MGSHYAMVSLPKDQVELIAVLVHNACMPCAPRQMQRTLTHVYCL